MEINTLAHGDEIEVLVNDGNQARFHVNIGDALLNGSPDQIWLKATSKGKHVYLRKLPQHPLSIGVALFNSKSELEQTINSGRFYIA